mmetsp:Transcript_14153/g.12490  ORF Transcript_14153/g.12490 Transcript_14153/m.12490 type:complete len:200 (+) Transcript_14153:758-1357(+)
MMGVLSYFLNKWYQHYGIKGAKNLQSFISVNMRGLPEKVEDVNLENDSVGIKFHFPIRGDFKQAIQDTKKSFSSLFTQIVVLSIKKFAVCLPFLPDFIGRMIVVDSLMGIDLVFSNVPFSAEPWYICNKEAKKIGVFSNVYYNWKIFFAACTYRDKLRLSLNANANLKMDPQLLLDYCHELLEEEIEKYGNNDTHLKVE